MTGRRLSLAALVVSAFMLAVPASAQRIVRVPAGVTSLEARWDWAADRAGDAVVVWSIEARKQNWIHGNSDQSLAEILGMSTKANQMAILVRTSSRGIRDIDTQDLESSWYDLPSVVYWLGETSQEESFRLLESLDPPTTEAEKGLIYAAGLHSEVARAGRMIRSALDSGPVDTRKAAAYSYAWHSGSAALETLESVATRDESSDVSKAAAYAIGSLDSDAALRSLERILDESDRREVRKAAVYAVGNIDLPRARQVLLNLIRTEQ